MPIGKFRHLWGRPSGLPPGFLPAFAATIAMAVVIILISIAIPRYEKSIRRAKETVLHNSCMAIRNAIDEYSYDKHKAPQSVHDLVSSGYLQDVPGDPITGSPMSKLNSCGQFPPDPMPDPMTNPRHWAMQRRGWGILC